MFKRFYATRPAPAPAPALRQVRDRWTDHVLLTAPLDQCRAYVQAYGGCYID